MKEAVHKAKRTSLSELARINSSRNKPQQIFEDLGDEEREEGSESAEPRDTAYVSTLPPIVEIQTML